MESNNNLQPINVANIPQNPNDFMPDMLSFQEQKQVQQISTQPESPIVLPPPDVGEQPQQKKTEGEEKQNVINPEIAQLFNEEPAQIPESAPAPNVSKSELFDRLLNDEKFRKAFIAKYEPQLVKPLDPNASAMQRLKEEFGDNFLSERFNKEDTGIPGTESFMYVRKYDQYMREAETASKDTPQDFENIVREYQASVENEARELQTQKSKCMQMYGWDENAFNGFVGWASKLSLVDLGYIWNRAKAAKKNVPTVNPVFMAPGNPNNQNPYNDMISVFGPPISTY